MLGEPWLRQDELGASETLTVDWANVVFGQPPPLSEPAGPGGEGCPLTPSWAQTDLSELQQGPHLCVALFPMLVFLLALILIT